MVWIPSKSLIGVGWVVLSSQIGLLAPIRVTEISTVSGSTLAACHRVTHGIVILANCPPPTSPLGTGGALKVPQTPRASTAPLHSLLGATQPTSVGDSRNRKRGR